MAMLAKSILITAVAALLVPFSAAAQTQLFSEDFSDATGAPLFPTGDDRSERYQPTFYFDNPFDAQWVFTEGTFLAASQTSVVIDPLPVTLPDGDIAVLLNESPLHALALRQSIIVAPGTPLTLTFDHWGDNRPDDQNYIFEVYANQTLIGTVNRGYNIPGPGASESFSWFADSTGLLLLSFRDASTGQASGIIDNIVLTAIPEPGTYALLLAGLGLMGFVATRRRQVRRFAA